MVGCGGLAWMARAGVAAGEDVRTWSSPVGDSAAGMAGNAAIWSSVRLPEEIPRPQQESV